jgi:hypothetical protein
LVEGTVDQHDQAFPTEEQVKSGCTLTEVAYPRLDCVVLVAMEGELRCDGFGVVGWLLLS